MAQAQKCDVIDKGDQRRFKATATEADQQLVLVRQLRECENNVEN